MNIVRRSRRRPRLGQHILCDQSVIERIITAFAASRDDFVVEIGPGRGALTRLLLQQLDSLHVVEKDRAMADFLRNEYAGSNLIIHMADAVKFCYRSILPSPSSRMRVIGNLPYAISTPLLFGMLQLGSNIKDMMFMVQREVADRLLAQPGGGSYGRLTIMAGVNYQITRLCNVAPGAFNPPPKVRSSVLRFTPLLPPVVIADGDLFADIVRCAFSARRKTLANALAPYIDVPGIKALDIDPGARPAELSIQQYVRLSSAVATS